MAQNSNHFCLEFNFSSNFEPSQNFRTKKSEPTQNLDTWSRFRRENKEKRNGSNFEPSQSYACTESRAIVSFDDFLSHLRYPPVPFRIVRCNLPNSEWANEMLTSLIFCKNVVWYFEIDSSGFVRLSDYMHPLYFDFVSVFTKSAFIQFFFLPLSPF